MKKIRFLKCVECGREYPQEEIKYTCPSCGGNMQVIYDYDAIKKRFSRASLRANRDMSIWRYMDILPLDNLSSIPPVQVGWTPLYKTDKLAKQLGLNRVYLKDDGRNPSASFKDRAGAVVTAYALGRGEKVITTASTGNAASSLACMTGSLDNIKTVIFVPQTAPAPKIAQLLVFGAEVIMVKGTYDDAFDLCLKASEEYGWYNRSTGINPFTREGKKTCAFEICEQLGWEVPDKVVVSVGDGNIISGIWKGFKDFYRLGLIDKLPQLVAAQAEGSAAVKNAVDSGRPIEPVSGKTVADSISVCVPRDGSAAVKAVKESGGFAVAASDAEILAAIPEIARGANVFAEPAAACSYACLKKAAASGRIGKDESVVFIVTGNGLKDVQSAMKSVGSPYCIAPDMSELEKLVSDRNIA